MTDHLEQLLKCVTFNPVLGWADALSIVVSELAARGGEIGLVRPGESPNILASYGEIKSITTNKEVWRFFCNCFAEDLPIGDLKAELIELPERAACIAMRRTEGEIVGGVFWVGARTTIEDIRLARIFIHLFALQINTSNEVEHRAPQKLVHAPDFPPGYIVGCSPAVNLLHKELRSLSRGTFPVLILGETGVGKEYIAAILHLWSERYKGPFIAVNCAAIPHELWEAEMFGIGKGVATGVMEREGYFQRAHGGTIFLDEIGDIPLASQAKLLRVLQNQMVQRVGGVQVKTDVRVLTATNTDLLKRIHEGSYRADLYYRLAGVTLYVPALRERREDLPLLLHYFLDTFASEARKTIKGFSLEAFEKLNDYDWPGNIREIENEVRRLVYLCPEGQVIDSSLLSLHITQPDASTGAEVVAQGERPSLNLASRLDAVEHDLIQQALAEAKGNKSAAAKLLGVTRNGLMMKMERLGIQS